MSNPKYFCGFCNKQFSGKQSFSNHRRLYHRPIPHANQPNVDHASLLSKKLSPSNYKPLKRKRIKRAMPKVAFFSTQLTNQQSQFDDVICCDDSSNESFEYRHSYSSSESVNDSFNSSNDSPFDITSNGSTEDDDDSVLNPILQTAHPVEATLLNIMQTYSIPSKAYQEIMKWSETAMESVYPYSRAKCFRTTVKLILSGGDVMHAKVARYPSAWHVSGLVIEELESTLAPGPYNSQK